MRRSSLMFVLLGGLAIGTASTVSVSPASAADPTAYQRQVYAEVNQSLDGMRTASKTFSVDGAPVEIHVTTWSDGSGIRKMTMSMPDDHGDNIQDYYYDRGALVFVYEVITTQDIRGGSVSREENRYYFENNQMFRWLDSNKQSVSRSDEEFVTRESEMLQTSEEYIRRMGNVSGSGKGKAKDSAGGLHTTTGIFEGFEQGDYLYLNLTVGRETKSYMVLNPDRSLEQLIDQENRYRGRSLSVTWKTTVETLEEAGGKVEVTQAVSVQLAK